MIAAELPAEAGADEHVPRDEGGRGTVRATDSAAGAAQRTILEQPHRRAASATSAAALTSARFSTVPHGAVPFLDRGAHLETLLSWVRADDPFAVRVVEGRAGAGRTRLALELCRRIEAESPVGAGEAWFAGFLPRDASLDEIDALERLTVPRLVVVDSAEIRPAHVAALLSGLADSASASALARVVLLLRSSARDEGSDAGWQDAVWGHDAFAGELLEEASRTDLDGTPMSLEERADLFAAARQTFAAPTGGSDAPAVDLSGAGLSQPLDIVMAAFLSARDGAAPASRSAMLDAVVVREASGWSALWGGRLPHPGDDALAEAVALAALAESASPSDARQLLSSTPQLAGRPPEELDAVDDWLCSLGPAGEASSAAGRWQPLEPDALGDHLIARHLGAVPAVLEAVLHPSRGAEPLVRSFGVLARVAEADHRVAATAAPVIAASLAEFTALAVAEADDAQRYGDGFVVLPDALAALVDALGALLPAQAVSRAEESLPLGDPLLDGLAAALAAALVAHSRPLAASGSTARTVDLARALDAHGVRLAALGRQHDAVAAYDESIELYRRLAADDPATYRAELARALTDYADHLAELGRRKEALVPAEEAAGLYRMLILVDAAAHLPDLATALNSHAIRLADLGRREDALAAAEEAVSLRRVLAGADPSRYTTSLASALSNHASRLADLGRREQSLAPSAEAVALYRTLAESDPAGYLAELAGALNSLATRLAELGRREDALLPAEEAVALRRVLAKADPVAHTAALAGALNNYANRLAELGRQEDALAPAGEVVELRRVLADLDPVAHTPALATALNNYAIRLAELGQRGVALAPAEEAVALRRQLVEVDPAAYTPALATALNNYANRLVELGRRADASAIREERHRLLSGTQ